MPENTQSGKAGSGSAVTGALRGVAVGGNVGDGGTEGVVGCEEAGTVVVAVAVGVGRLAGELGVLT